MSSDDILARLTDVDESLYRIGGAWERDVVRDAAAAIEARDAEIARLRAALALAVGELSTYGPMQCWSPEQLMQHFLEEARREQ